MVSFDYHQSVHHLIEIVSYYTMVERRRACKEKVLSGGVDLGQVKKKRKPSVPWMKLFNLPLEIIEIIFQEIGLLDYWTFRIFREFERFRAYLDPRYLIQTNLDAHHLMYSIPKDQSKENHYFTNSDQFIKNFELHCKIYGVEKKSVFLFMEIEVSRNVQGQDFKNIVEYLTLHKVGFKLFLRAITFLDSTFPVEMSVMEDLLLNETLTETEVIFDQNYANEFIKETFFKIEDFKGCKFYQYPEEINVNSDFNSIASCLLDLQNIKHKNSIRNVAKIAIKGIPSVLTRLDPKAFERLQTLRLISCVKPLKKTQFLNMALPSLKSLALGMCQVSKFTNNDLPNLQDLSIKESLSIDSQRRRCKFKLKMCKNNLPKLLELNISTNKIDQIYQNNFGETLDFFLLDSSFEVGGSLGDVPHMISVCKKVILETNEASSFMLKDIFGSLSSTETVKELRLNDPFTDDLKYLEGRKFPNLETLQLTDYNSNIRDFPRVNMPVLKTLTFFETDIENVDINGLDNLKTLIFTSDSRERPNRGINNRGWFPRTIKDYFVINFEQIPSKLRAGKINLRHHKATTFNQDKIPVEYAKFVPPSPFNADLDELNNGCVLY